MNRKTVHSLVAGLLALLAAHGAVAADAGTPLTLKAAGHDLTVAREADGSWTISTTGTDPYVFADGPPATFDPVVNRYLAFEYQATAPIHGVQAMLFAKGQKPAAVDVGAINSGANWLPFSIDLKPAISKLPGGPVSVRLDFGSEPGKTVRLRALQLRPATEAERAAKLARERRVAEDARRERQLLDYISKKMPEDVGSVTVQEKAVRVEGTLSDSAHDVYLAEAPADLEIIDAQVFPFVAPITPDASGHFSATFDRYRTTTRGKHDRLLSRWAIVRKAGERFELLSHARWPDTVASKWQTPQVHPKTKKGLGGFSAGRYPVSDLDDLGISAVTVNVALNGVMRTEPGRGRTPFEYGGRTWYADDRAVANLDRTFLAAAERNIVVSAIVLIGRANTSPDKAWGRIIAHPDADPAGTFAMPNVIDEQGVQAYAAGLDFLAQRYSGPPEVAVHGRVHHWIVHNEVDAGWEWTNAGEKSLTAYVDLYHRSCRIVQLVARQYDPHAKAFVSLTHHWAKAGGPHFYAGRDVLETFAALAKAEGDFDWGLAYHPYPQDLFEPRSWLDKEATASFDTPMITFRNIEVLDASMRQPRMMFQGKSVRTIHLSEQGPNSRDYSEQALNVQAASMAYAWNKIRDLPSIEAFQYHNWADNRGEGGIRIGLRRFPDDATDPLGRKPVWCVYQALGTAGEDAATAFAKPIIGIESWKQVKMSVAQP